MRRWIVLLAFAPLSALAETAYVTDNLRLNVYATADFSGSAIRTLQSGDAFEVLSRGQLAANILTVVRAQVGAEAHVAGLDAWAVPFAYACAQNPTIGDVGLPFPDNATNDSNIEFQCAASFSDVAGVTALDRAL